MRWTGLIGVLAAAAAVTMGIGVGLTASAILEGDGHDDVQASRTAPPGR